MSIAEQILNEARSQGVASSVRFAPLSVSAALSLLRRSQSTLEARFAGAALRRSVAAKASEGAAQKVTADDAALGRVRDALALLRQTRSLYEATLAASALRAAMRAVTGHSRPPIAGSVPATSE